MASDETNPGRRGRYCERHRPGYRRRHILQFRRLVAMDLPHEHAADRPHYPGRHILHAAQEGGGRLAGVRTIIETGSAACANREV